MPGTRFGRRLFSLGVRILPQSVVISVLIAACGSATARTADSAAAHDNSPGNVAVRYVDAVYTGHLSTAKSLVIASDRGAFGALALVLAEESLSERNVSVGSVTISGKNASVIVLGTLCTQPGGSVTSQASRKVSCVTNRNSHSTNSTFQVLLQSSGQRWQVRFG